MICGCIRPQYSHELAERLNLPQCPCQGLITDVAFHIDEKQIFPRSALERTRLDPQKTNRVIGKGLERAVERSDFIADRHQQRGLIMAARLAGVLFTPE